MLQQPSGQKPILEPLVPPEAGVSPNYSKNIQSTSSEGDAVQTNQTSQSVADNPALTGNTVVVSDSHFAYWVGGIVIFLVLLGIVAWKQKWMVFSKALALLIVPVTLALFIYNSQLSFAQQPVQQPVKQPVQRSIIEEGSEELEVYSSSGNGGTDTSDRLHFSLGAIGLVIIAIAGIGYYIVSQKKNT